MRLFGSVNIVFHRFDSLGILGDTIVSTNSKDVSIHGHPSRDCIDTRSMIVSLRRYKYSDCCLMSGGRSVNKMV